MSFLLSCALLLEIQIPESIQSIWALVTDNPITSGVVAGGTAIAGILAFFDEQLKVVSSILETWAGIRAKFGGSAAATPEADLQTYRDKLIKAFEIKLGKRRRDVLGKDQLIALDYEPRPEEIGSYQKPAPTPEAPPPVERTFRTQLQNLNPMRLFKRSEQEPVELPPQKKMIDVFRGEDERLFILGAPGSGKTTTLLELAQELLATAAENEQAPIPIIFELSNWKDDQQPIDQWLVAQLNEEYNVPIEVGQCWIKDHQIVPLLDGLDELGGVRLPKCVAKLNEFLPKGEPDRQAVVCCRVEEFHQGEMKLRGLNGAVELQPLSESQIQGYLTAVGQPSLWEQVIKPSEALTNLAQTPLMLTVMAVALANRSTAVTQLDELFKAYIEERFKRYKLEHDGNLPYSRRQTRQYLERLAKQLKAQSTTTFLIRPVGK